MTWVPRWIRRVLLSLSVGVLAYVELLVVLLPLSASWRLGLAALPALGAGALFYREVPTVPPVSGEDLLHVMLVSFYGPAGAAGYRANVMYYDPAKKKLRIRFSYNMTGYVDRKIQLSPGKGCAGQCYSTEDITVFDFSKMTHASFGIDSKKTPVWADLRSIISFPLRKSEDKVVGVLTIDSREPMEKTGFTDSNFQAALGLYADLVLRLLERD